MKPTFRPPIIMNGVLYYETAEPPRYGTKAVDVRTGETNMVQKHIIRLGLQHIKNGSSTKITTTENQHGGLCISLVHLTVQHMVYA